MLDVLKEFYTKLDEVMCQSLHKRITLYGNGRSGRYIRWYAKFFHNISIDYYITLDGNPGRSYEQELFYPTLFDFDYKDFKDSIIWLAEPLNSSLKQQLEGHGFIKDLTYYDFYSRIYGDDIEWGESSEDPFESHKTGRRDIQAIEWLEWRYGCNFVTAIPSSHFKVSTGAPYILTAQPEIFSILGNAHIVPSQNDAVLDFGCGKGGAMVSFLDYGFRKVGGIEFEPDIYKTLTNNFDALAIGNDNGVETFEGDAASLTGELDSYTFFYFFHPFGSQIYNKCIDNIIDSIHRKKREITIVALNPIAWEYIENTGMFRLWSQHSIDTRQRVVNIYHSK